MSNTLTRVYFALRFLGKIKCFVRISATIISD